MKERERERMNEWKKERERINEKEREKEWMKKTKRVRKNEWKRERERKNGWGERGGGCGECFVLMMVFDDFSQSCI